MVTPQGLDDDLCTLVVERAADRRVVALVGEIDLSNATDIGDRLVGTIEGGEPRPIVLVLDRLEYLDSTGVTAMLRVGDEAARAGVDLTVVASPTSPIRRLLEITGLAGELGCRDTPP